MGRNITLPLHLPTDIYLGTEGTGDQEQNRQGYLIKEPVIYWNPRSVALKYL